MKKRMFVPVLVAGCSFLLAGTGIAADQMSDQSQQQTNQQQQQPFAQQQKQQTQYAQQLSFPETLSQAKIQNQQGQELGKVEQVLLDSQQGDVKFVLMKSESGAMEIVPWDALKLQQQQGQQAQQDQQAQQGQMTLVLQETQEQYSSPDKFKNAKIQDSQGNELGTVESALVDAQAGKIGYVLVKTKTGPQAIVPFSALEMQQGQQGQQQQGQQGQQQGQITFVVQGEAPELKESPEGQIPNVLDREQGEMIHQYYGVAPYWEGEQQQQQQEQEPMDQKEQENINILEPQNEEGSLQEGEPRSMMD